MSVDAGDVGCGDADVNGGTHCNLSSCYTEFGSSRIYKCLLLDMGL